MTPEAVKARSSPFAKSSREKILSKSVMLASFKRLMWLSSLGFQRTKISPPRHFKAVAARTASELPPIPISISTGDSSRQVASAIAMSPSVKS